jgi:outer membrane protein OmpA-like peptidoglycan-associated protein
MSAARLAVVLLVVLLVPQNAEWTKTSSVVRDSPEAELIVRVGDIDNLGFGWEPGFDPFTGRSTAPHDYPYTPSPSDPPGTDRIMIPTGYKYGGPEMNSDGYTGSTKRPGNNPQPVVLEYQLGQTVPKAALLRMFIDDFQSPPMRSSFQATLNGERAPFLERVLNAVEQTGPIGKMIAVTIPTEYLRLLTGGKLTIFIDDPQTGIGDGFALDFIELLINPKTLRHVGTVTGTVTNKETQKPIAGAVVWGGGAETVTTDRDGRYTLANVAAGLAVATASFSGFDPGTASNDLESGKTLTLDIALAPSKQETAENLATALVEKGRAVLYGIRFDSNSAVPRPESADTLNQLLALLRDRPSLGLIVEGHTDSQNTAEYNQKLSEDRAKAVVAWLVKNGVAAARLQPVGCGLSRPIADNGTAEGRALNRRVEVQAMPEKR